jgi:hypothetical protein
MGSKLTTLQAFNAIVKFLDDYYNKTGSDDIGSLLGDMSFFSDGSTADEAIWQDWMDAIGTDQPVTKLEAYDAAIKFLEYYCNNTSSDDIRSLLNSMHLGNKETAVHSAILNLWTQCVDKTLDEPENLRNYLQFTK